MVGRASSVKLSTVMLGWTRLTRIVRVWRCTTLCAQRRRVSASRKIRSNKFARNEGLKVENEKLSVKMCLTKVIHWNQAKFGADAGKYVSDDAKKTLVEVTQLLESMLEQSSKSGMRGLTYEALKTKPQMRKVHQVKERREVLEKIQEFNKEKGRMTTTNWGISQQCLTVCSWNRTQDLWRQHSSSSKNAVDAKDAEAAKRGKPEVKNSTS